MEGAMRVAICYCKLSGRRRRAKPEWNIGRNVIQSDRTSSTNVPNPPNAGYQDTPSSIVQKPNHCIEQPLTVRIA
jgi:hypothetical protein